MVWRGQKFHAKSCHVMRSGSSVPSFRPISVARLSFPLSCASTTLLTSARLAKSCSVRNAHLSAWYISIILFYGHCAIAPAARSEPIALKMAWLNDVSSLLKSAQAAFTLARIPRDGSVMHPARPGYAPCSNFQRLSNNVRVTC